MLGPVFQGSLVQGSKALGLEKIVHKFESFSVAFAGRVNPVFCLAGSRRSTVQAAEGKIERVPGNHYGRRWKVLVGGARSTGGQHQDHEQPGRI